MDRQKCDDERWLVSENATEFQEEEEDDEEALSLSDLPIIHQRRIAKEKDDDKNKSSPARADEFDFCSVSKESEMCAADEVFFQGQILPLRYSVSSEQHYDGRRYRSYSVSRSDSMDHFYSSRSSSGSSSSTATAAAAKYKPKVPPRNRFHSHPSPSPRLHFPSSGATHRKKSSIWNLLAPPEIAFHDLKARCNNFGSRNSNSSSSVMKKMRPRLLGGCKCAADAVAPPGVARNSSAGESEVAALNSKPQKLKKKLLSHHRTFEWLKQLSVEGDE